MTGVRLLSAPVNARQESITGGRSLCRTWYIMSGERRIDMTEYYVTFGQKVRQDPNPVWPHAHADGYLTVVPPDGTEDTARAMADAVTGGDWSMIQRDTPTPKLFPLGQLGKLSIQPAWAS